MKLGYQSKLRVFPQVIDGSLCRLWAIFPATENCITTPTKKPPDAPRLMIVIDRQAAKVTNIMADSAYAALLVCYSLVVFYGDTVTSAQQSIQPPTSPFRALIHTLETPLFLFLDLLPSFGRSDHAFVIGFSGGFTRARSAVFIDTGNAFRCFSPTGGVSSTCPASVLRSMVSVLIFTFAVFTPRPSTVWRSLVITKGSQRFKRPALCALFLGYNVFSQGMNLLKLGFALARLVQGTQSSVRAVSILT